MIENGIEATARGIVQRVREATTQKGTVVLEVSLDCSKMYKGKKQHSYCTAKFYGDAANEARGIIQQGMTVRVTGSPSSRAYVNKNNETKSTLELSSYRGFEIIQPVAAVSSGYQSEHQDNNFNDDIRM